MPLPTGTIAGRSLPPARRKRRGLYKDCEVLDEATVSDLSPEEISRMGRGELVRVVHIARTPAASVRLEYLDHQTLLRLAHQARLACCHRNR